MTCGRCGSLATENDGHVCVYFEGQRFDGQPVDKRSLTVSNSGAQPSFDKYEGLPLERLKTEAERWVAALNGSWQSRAATGLREIVQKAHDLGAASAPSAGERSQDAEALRKLAKDHDNDKGLPSSTCDWLIALADRIDAAPSTAERLLREIAPVLEEWDGGLDEMDGEAYEEGAKAWDEMMTKVRAFVGSAPSAIKATYPRQETTCRATIRNGTLYSDGRWACNCGASSEAPECRAPSDRTTDRG